MGRAGRAGQAGQAVCDYDHNNTGIDIGTISYLVAL